MPRRLPMASPRRDDCGSTSRSARALHRRARGLLHYACLPPDEIPSSRTDRRSPRRSQCKSPASLGGRPDSLARLPTCRTPIVVPRAGVLHAHKHAISRAPRLQRRRVLGIEPTHPGVTGRSWRACSRASRQPARIHVPNAAPRSPRNAPAINARSKRRGLDLQLLGSAPCQSVPRAARELGRGRTACPKVPAPQQSALFARPTCPAMRVDWDGDDPEGAKIVLIATGSRSPGVGGTVTGHATVCLVVLQFTAVELRLTKRPPIVAAVQGRPRAVSSARVFAQPRLESRRSRRDGLSFGAAASSLVGAQPRHSHTMAA